MGAVNQLRDDLITLIIHQNFIKKQRDVQL